MLLLLPLLCFVCAKVPLLWTNVCTLASKLNWNYDTPLASRMVWQAVLRINWQVKINTLAIYPSLVFFMAPLTALTRNWVNSRNWSSEEESGFQELKCAFSSATDHQPDPTIPFSAEVDACVDVGAVLKKKKKTYTPLTFFIMPSSSREKLQH